MYHTSNAREPVEKNSITLDFPAIGTCVADSFYFKRIPHHGARPKNLRNTCGIAALADSPRENVWSRHMKSIMNMADMWSISAKHTGGSRLKRKRPVRVMLATDWESSERQRFWSPMAAMEYQHIYCETLPEKIAGAPRAIMDGMAAVAEKNAAIQAKLTGSVVKGTKSPAPKIQLTGWYRWGWLPDLPAGLREPAILDRLPHRHRKDIPLALVLHPPSG